VYSFGITLWEAVERQRPWQDLDDMQIWASWISDPQAHQATLTPLQVETRTGRCALREAQQLVCDACTHQLPVIQGVRSVAEGGKACMPLPMVVLCEVLKVLENLSHATGWA
jgi:hypothetical protein